MKRNKHSRCRTAALLPVTPAAAGTSTATTNTPRAMKRNKHSRCRTAALLLLVTLAASCSRNDDFAPAGNPDPVGATAAALTLAVTDGAYAPADDGTPATRTVERGYATEFTEGDCIGVYRVETGGGETPAVTENIPATFNGTEWVFPSEQADKMLTYAPSPGRELHYFAYYPYRQEGLGFKSPALNSAPEFFRTGILDWRPDYDQSTYEAYTASDLMVAKGEITPRTDGKAGSVLRFTMQHQTGLIVIQVPTVKYTYTETIGGKTVEKSYRLYTGIGSSGGGSLSLQENSYTLRRLLNGESPLPTIYYYNSAFKKRELDIKSFGKPGTYNLITVDGGAETVTARPLREGDFYMKDGSILPQESVSGAMPDEVRKDCLGVVFWVGEKDGLHWTQTDRAKGDHLLMREHPACMHGMAVALNDASAGAQWATGEGANEALYDDWAAKFSGFTPEEQADRQDIFESGPSYGYKYSRVMKLYGAYHSGTAFPALDAVTDYAAAHPAPGNSSGWFFPGRYELATLCFGVPESYGDGNIYLNLEMLRKINPLIEKAGGSKLEGSYWSNTDFSTTSWRVDVSTPDYNTKLKSDAHKVRAVLAF